MDASSDEVFKKTSSCCCTPPPDIDGEDSNFPLVSLRPARRSRSVKYQSGYDCEFVTPPPSVLQSECSVCLLIMREPHLISCCGQNYCRQCIHQVLDKNKPCPLCKATPFTVLHNKGLERSLVQMEVRCSNHKLGCPWTGELRDYERHLNLNPSEPDSQLEGCKYVTLACPYLCGSWFQRGAIPRHQKESCPKRPFCCDYCRDYNSVQADVVYRHWPVCKCYPVDCPNHCSVYLIERQHLEEHLNLKCPLRMIECEFRSAGCDEMIAREDMQDHLEEFHLQHTTMLAVANQKLQEEVAEKEAKIAKLTEDFKAEVAKVREDGHETMDRLLVENAFLKIELTNIRTEMEGLRREFLSSLAQHKEAQEWKEESAKSAYQVLETDIVSLKSELEESRFSLSQQCYSIKSYVGIFPVEFQMAGFSQHLAENREWRSPAFYSHLEGYRLCLVVYPRGKGRGNESYVSVFACVLRGEYDDHLKWPLMAELTVQLRNQHIDRYHATGVIRFTEVTPTKYSSRVMEGEEEREGWGLERFIEHSKLGYYSAKNREYLKDDRLCFRLTRVQL